MSPTVRIMSPGWRLEVALTNKDVQATR